jgi:hypothetical protein
MDDSNRNALRIYGKVLRMKGVRTGRLVFISELTDYQVLMYYLK